MRALSVTGGDGVRLHVEDGGHRAGPPILFIHGLSHCGLAWRRQVASELGDELRLVTFDLRGHGRSDKPRAGYDDGDLWADDVHAVIETLELERPVLCAWSYGGLVVCDYLRRYGQERIGAINLVGAITKLGTDEGAAVIVSAFGELLPGLFSTDAEQSAQAQVAFARLCVADEPAPEDAYLAVGCQTVVPPRVRQALLSRRVENDDLLGQITCPVLVTHGERDAIIDPAAATRHAEAIPGAEVSLHPTGHAPFLEAPARFNRELRELALSSAAAPARG
jgi:non-heme chloroperoxidase